MTQYIIESNECDELSGEALCWNNEDGWVDRASATLFEIDEVSGYLPIGSKRIVKVQP